MTTNEMKMYIQGAGDCIVTKSLLNGEAALKWMFRGEALDPYDNGWIAYGEGDTQEYVNDTDNLAIVDFNTLANIEPAVLMIYEMSIGADLEFKSDTTGKYFIDLTTGQEIRNKVKSPLMIAFEQNLEFLRKDEYTYEFLQSLFVPSEKIQPFVMGEIDMPTGELVIADPLAYLYQEKYAQPLNRKFPAGSYPVELAICHSDIAGKRIAAARLKVKEQRVVRYETVMPKGKTIEQLNEPGAWFFLGVDAGMAAFCDASVAIQYREFLSRWHGEHPESNHYDDYFADILAASYSQFPDMQREGGDFIEWAVPETGKRIAMFSSGLGDGLYTGLWGLDEQDEVCEVVIPFMNVAYF